MYSKTGKSTRNSYIPNVSRGCRNIHGLQYAGNCKVAKSSEDIHEMVEDAMKSLQTVNNDNRAILESRCEWMLSKFYWYMNDKQKAQYHIDQ